MTGFHLVCGSLQSHQNSSDICGCNN